MIKPVQGDAEMSDTIKFAYMTFNRATGGTKLYVSAKWKENIMKLLDDHFPKTKVYDFDNWGNILVDKRVATVELLCALGADGWEAVSYDPQVNDYLLKRVITKEHFTEG